MLNKIGAALVQFIPPIASSARQPIVNGDKQNKDNKNFQRFRPKPQEPPAPQGHKEEPAPSKQTLPQKAASPPLDSGGVAHAFIHLISLFQKKRTALSKWFGMRSYQAAAKDQKHAVKTRKGAVINDRAA